MATTQTPKSNEAKVEKEKKPAVPAYIRLTKSLKAEAMRGKLSAEELDKIATLAGGLKAFITA